MRIKKIGQILDALFPESTSPLIYHSHYTLLIAVLLSARSTDKQVNEVTPTLFSLADTPEKMVQLPLETIQSIIRPCGLSPTKAKAIQKLSEILIERFKGSVPASLEELETLPGVGHKTASVVLAQGFNLPAFPVDTHIHRSAKRWGLSSGKSVKQTEEDLKLCFPKEEWIRRHLQILYFARTYCPAKNHNPKECPICAL